MPRKSIQEEYNLPNSLKVLAKKDSSGGFIIKLADYPGAITYAATAGEFVPVLNDMVLTYFEVPNKVAQKLEFFYVPKSVAQQKPRVKSVISRPREFVPFTPCYA
jgi:hypothetical protein